MVRIGTVWDRTVEVLQGRSGILAAIAILYLFVPNVVSAAIGAFLTPGIAGKLVIAIVNLAVVLLLIVGVLAITAVASDPAVDRAAADRAAWRHLGRALLVILAVVVVAAVAFGIPAVLIAASGATMNEATGQVDMSAASPGMAALGGLAGLVALAFLLWLSARLVPLLAVIVNEGLGFAAVRRSLALTRGSAAKLIGVIILFGIVVMVVLMAATMVTGTVFGLLIGSTGTVAFLVALVGAVVTAGATVLQSVFYARFYVAAREARDVVPPAVA